MKKLDSKFFITCGFIILLPILVLIILFLVRGCDGGKDYKDYENLMIKKAQSYAKKHKMYPQKGKQILIKLEELERDGLKSPDKSLKDSTCNGSVIIKNTSNNIEKEKKYLYIPYLECNKYKTEYLKDHLLKDVTKNNSGLYKSGEEYIYKGNKVNNYISFYGVTYRIIKITKNGNLKLIKTVSQEISSNWDNKYNIDKKAYSGVNNFDDSIIFDKLTEDYNNVKNFSEKAKAHLVTQDICIGKRKTDDLNKEITTECDKVLENQVISLPSVTDFTLASYDANCNKIGDLSCTNYNYFTDFLDYSWTVDSVLEDSSLVYYITAVDSGLETANKYKKYNLVIFLDGEEIYQSGNGTKDDPYVIE